MSSIKTVFLNSSQILLNDIEAYKTITYTYFKFPLIYLKYLSAVAPG